MKTARGEDEPTLTFWGAAAAVTGSMHLLDANNQRLLLDCGLYQGRRDEARRRNERFPFEPRSISAAICSHAHIDHSGNLPTLVRKGFTGPIYCTPPTRDLLRIMLRDSAKIQEEEAAFLNIQRNYAHPLIEPLYTMADAERCLARVQALPYNRVMDLGDGVRFHFLEAGHVLGSAMVHVTVDRPGGVRTLCFTGDLGRRGLPILKPTRPVPPADVLVCESTYGNRLHPPFEDTVASLYDTVSRTIARGGKVLIPAFSLGRSQLIIHLLQLGLREGRIPRVPILVDSPMAAQVAQVYRSHPDCLDDATAKAVREGHGLLGGDGVEYLEAFEESLEATTRPGAAIIVAASGMCDAGRIVDHLCRNVDDPRCCVILVSYQAQGTTGRRLLEPGPKVRIQGRDYNKWIEVVQLNGFSGHADKADFIAHLQPLAGQVRSVRLIHGERDQAEALAATLEGIGFSDVSVPDPGESVIL